MRSKTIDTVIEDIYGLFAKEHTPSEENIKYLCDSITEVVKYRLASNQSQDKPQLRMSKIGSKNRKLYFELNAEPTDKAHSVDPATSLKFMYGDLIEALLLFLVKESGHTVEGEQGELDIDGVLGHRDCIIDGITTDVKSTSKFAFPKFSKGTLFHDDPFGYIGQISAYAYHDKSPFAAFLAMNKETGELALLKVDPIDMIDPPSRIAEIKEMLTKPLPPEEKCYPDEPMGTKGNRVINKNCGYCAFKEKCWKDANNGQGLKKFRYSNGIQYFTSVLDTPRVDEVVE